MANAFHTDVKDTSDARDYQRKPAPATFAGYQEHDSPGLQRPLEIWLLTEDIPGHPVGSTVSRRTLEKAGFVVPPVSA